MIVMINMPQIYLKTKYYDQMIRKHMNPNHYVNELVERALKEEKAKKEKATVGGSRKRDPDDTGNPQASNTPC